MVKFGRELEAEGVPEWKDKYIDYKQLKKPIKKIKLLGQPKPDNDLFGGSIFGPVSGLARKFFGWFRISGDTSGQVKAVVVEGHASEDEEEPEEYSEDVDGGETEVVESVSESEEEVNKFLALLENELVKVNDFHHLKEAEMVERAATLNNQLLTLLHLRHISPDAGDPNNALKSTRNSHLSSGMCESETDVQGEDANKSVRIDVDASGGGGAAANNNGKGNSSRDMFASLLRSSKRRCESADFIQKKMESGEKMIRDAHIQIYRALFRLQSFSSLNMLGFTKIMKKFDKVGKLTTEVEGIFTEHFAGSDRKKAMKLLKPPSCPHSSMQASFLVGVLTGCSVTLFIVYAALAHHLYGFFLPLTATTTYMEAVYPVFSIFALMSLHLFMYGCNLLFWKAKRINYIFIFDFQSRTALKHIDAFLICTTVMAVVVATMFIHLLLKTGGFSPTAVDTIPGFLLLSFIVVLICPLNIFYRPRRYCFLRVMRNIMCSPLCKVLMVDFFMADQLTSQITLLRHIETTACYYAASSFRTHDIETCKTGKHYRQLAYVISFSPYYWRAMQCLRRWFEESNTTHLANTGKYLSAMVAAGARLRYAQQKGSLVWMIIVLVTSSLATIYQLYWDFVRDWGLINLRSKNRWLRDDLILKKKSIYYVSIVVNVVLRVAWVESMLRFKVGTLENGLLDFLMASLEVIRRGQWNFYSYFIL